MTKEIGILLVEDEEDDIVIALDAFKKAKIKNNVDVVDSGEEALAYLLKRGKKPVILFLDLKIGTISGFDVLTEIQKNKDLNGIQTIVLTTLDDHASIKKSFELGACAYITKPVDPIELIKKIIELKGISIEVCSIE